MPKPQIVSIHAKNGGRSSDSYLFFHLQLTQADKRAVYNMTI
jgi:hypothetical protein